MSTSNKRQCLYNDYCEVTLIKVKSLNCNEIISFKKFYNDLV